MFDELERGQSVLYGDSGGIWVMILFAPPTKDDMLLARPTLTAMRRMHPHGFPTLTWVLPEAGLKMEHDAREAASTVTQEFDRSIRAQATIIEGSGFQAATVRAIVTGLDAMSRSASPKKTFAELTPAVEWCAVRRPEGSPTFAVAEHVAALSQVRRSLVPRRA